MANDTQRLTTADLRRRLHGPAVTATVPVRDDPPAARRPVPLPTRIGEPNEALGLDRRAPGDAGHPPPFDPFAEVAEALAELTPIPVSLRSFPSVLRPPLVPAALSLSIDSTASSATRGDVLRVENEQLQQLLEEMRLVLQEANEQEHRHQAAMAERDLALTAALARANDLEAQIALKPKTRDELEEMADELERESFKITQERRALDGDRAQIREDEKSLEKQMREMEVGMARERAMLARQEQELKRLNGEIQHEFEAMQRGDGTLRDRLAVFQRRHVEVMGASPGVAVAVHGSHAGFTQSPIAPSAHPTPSSKKNDTTGRLRKLFRGGE